MLSGANRRVGFAQAREGAAWMYTHRVPLPGDQGSPWRLLGIHAVERNLAIARYCGADISHPSFHFPVLTEDVTSIHDVLNCAQVDNQECLIALAPWSRSALKSWPLNRFVQLAEELVRIPKLRVVVLGGPAESQLALEFRALESQGLVNLVGKFTLRQLPEVLKRMKLVVGNDSFLIHLAAGVGTKVVGIFGPTEPKATGPYPLSKHTVRRMELPCSPCGKRTCQSSEYLECLHSISVGSLIESIQEILGLPSPASC